MGGRSERAKRLHLRASQHAGTHSPHGEAGRPAAGDRVKVLEEVAGDAVGGNPTWYRIDGGRYAGAVVHSSLVAKLAVPRAMVMPRPEDAPPGLGTIVVSRSAATLTYLDADDKPT